MIDGIKTYDLKTNPQKLIDNPYLSEYWITTVHNADAVVKYEIAEYFGLQFQIKKENVKLQGSVHKYRNEGRHNYDDFTAVNVAEVVRELSERFEIDTAQTELNNVEFGVNVVLPFRVSVVLNNLIVYKGEPFMRVAEEGMNYYQCKKAQFIIKIYDKGLQYKLPDNVLRFEVKVLKMQYLKKKGITLRYLSDLLNVGIYEPLGNILTETFESILFGNDTLNESRLSRKELEIYLRGNNPKTWTPQKGETERKRLQRLEHDYTSIIERYRKGVNFKSVVAELVKTKSLELSRFYQVEEVVLSLENIPFLPFENESVKSQIVPYLHFSYSVNTGHTDNSKQDTKIHLCSGCGFPIETKGTYHNLDCKIRRDERNGRSNGRNNFKKRFRKLMNMPVLFDVSKLIKLSDQQKAWVNH